MDAIYLKSFRKDMFLSESFFMTLATAISKSSCISCMLLSTKLSEKHFRPHYTQAIAKKCRHAS